MNRFGQILAGIALAVPLAFAVSAQTPSAPTDGGRGMRHHGGGNFDPAAMAERRLASLKAKLNITGGQESQWQAFSARVKQDAETMKAQHAASTQLPSAAPDRMARHAEHMKQRATAMEGISASLRDLYAVLSTDQRAVADKHFAERGRGKGHGPRAQQS
jgi:periplasmic protein CpxP/Spy